MSRLESSILANQIRSCTVPPTPDGCFCRKYVKAPVPGEGPLDAKVIVVGRNPGADEDRLGRPFVGKSGQLLDSFLTTIGLQRPQVAIINRVKCWTPDNREPFLSEIQNCRKLFRRELIALDQKRVLFLMGDTVVHAFFAKSPGLISKIQGTVFWDTKTGVYFIPMTHPSFWSRGTRNKVAALEIATKLKPIISEILALPESNFLRTKPNLPDLS